MVRTAGKAGAALVVVAVAIELALQALAIVAVDRHTAWRAGATERVLCVGDSHTYGGGVRADEAYPAQLQRFLDEAAPGTYSVMNRGVPGFTSTQVRRRLPQWLADLDPTIVIVIAGANDVWNLAEMDDRAGGWRSRLAAWALRLRTVRLVQSWRAQRALDATLDNNRNPFGDRPKYVLGPEGYVDWGDGAERIVNPRRSGGVDLAMMRQAVSDYEEIARLTRERGVRLVFLGYPAPNGLFTALTNAMHLIATRERVGFVDAVAAVRRVPVAERTFTFGVHAGPAGLTEIARDLARTILAGPPAGANDADVVRPAAGAGP
jgi:lysophospholipase L1-like esterase